METSWSTLCFICLPLYSFAVPQAERGWAAGEKFTGETFAAFEVRDDWYTRTKITIQFLTDRVADDALLLYGGQNDGADFLSISLIRENLVFRFDCGEGAVEEVVDGPFQAGSWHEVTVGRHFCSRSAVRTDWSSSELNDVIPELQNFKGISIDSYLYLGGFNARNSTKKAKQQILERAATNQGFVGCIRYLKVNNDVLLDAEKSINLADKSTVSGFCSVYNKTAVHTAPKKLACSTNKCPSSSYCHMIAGVPICVPKDVDAKWSNELNAAEIADIQNLDEYLHVKLKFKAAGSIKGHLLHVNDGEEASQTEIYLDDGFVQLKISSKTASGVNVELRSNQRVNSDAWHEVEVWRSGRSAIFRLDKEEWSEKIDEFSGDIWSAKRRNTGYAIVGEVGVNATLNDDVTVYAGCIKEVMVNLKSIDRCLFFGRGSQNCCQSHKSRISKSSQFMSLHGDGYAKFTSPKILKNLANTNMEIGVEIRPEAFNYSNVPNRNNSHQVLVEIESTNGDIIAYLNENFQVLLRIRILGWQTVLTEKQPIGLGGVSWHVVKIARKSNLISLSVDGRDELFAKIDNYSFQIAYFDNYPKALYVGGVKGAKDFGFFGCVGRILLRENPTSKSIQLTGISRAEQALRIGECAA